MASKPAEEERGVITVDVELKAMNAISKAMAALEADAQQRVLAYFVNKYLKKESNGQ